MSEPIKVLLIVLALVFCALMLAAMFDAVYTFIVSLFQNLTYDLPSKPTT